jgi:hypothetical protein
MKVKWNTQQTDEKNNVAMRGKKYLNRESQKKFSIHTACCQQTHTKSHKNAL